MNCTTCHHPASGHLERGCLGNRGKCTCPGLTAEPITLRSAIEDEGPKPELHREVMRRHRKEWPTLWAAIDQLMQADQWTLAIKDGKACATGGEVWVDEGRYLVGPIDGEDQVLPEGIYTLTLIERK